MDLDRMLRQKNKKKTKSMFKDYLNSKTNTIARESFTRITNE